MPGLLPWYVCLPRDWICLRVTLWNRQYLSCSRRLVVLDAWAAGSPLLPWSGQGLGLALCSVSPFPHFSSDRPAHFTFLVHVFLPLLILQSVSLLPPSLFPLLSPCYLPCLFHLSLAPILPVMFLLHYAVEAALAMGAWKTFFPGALHGPVDGGRGAASVQIGLNQQPRGPLQSLSPPPPLVGPVHHPLSHLASTQEALAGDCHGLTLGPSAH